ncbi:uncharacterized protein [Miscanthus floridulus]|uniref:uncharacterized protein n=1 Tax=Miscanthus floridulus TaxID=154761 RepID=UPI00345B3865
MAMAAGAALLRSVATKMARAPPRLPSALQHHGHGLPPTSSNRLWLSGFSTTSTASTPPPTNLRGPQTYNKKVPDGNEWDWFIAGVKDAAPKAAYSLVFSGFAFIYFYVIPALDRIDAKLDAQRVAWVTMREEIKKDHERTRAVLLSNKESQIEARDVVGKFSEGQRIHASGQGKEQL